MELGLKGKVALVTGAGSQVGFGRAICMLLAQEGCDIIASDINLEGCKQTVAEVEKLGHQGLAVKCDITKKADCEAQAKAALDKFGKIDILVNNAGGIAAQGGPFEKQQEADWGQTNLNLKGPAGNSLIPEHCSSNTAKIIVNWILKYSGVDMYSISKPAHSLSADAKALAK
jgi:NAD(P)-dependent dehydrogenase (short-subunit alcohol dehydrogenase family)